MRQGLAALQAMGTELSQPYHFALLAGSTAQKAVQIACEIDTGSGGDVLVHRLKP